MKKLFWALLLAITLLSAGIFTYALNTPANDPEQPRIVEQEPEQPTVEELLRLVNEERAKVGAKPLTLNDGVMKSAQLKADDMHKRNYFEHEVKGTDDVLTPEMAKYAFANNQCDAVSENIYQQTLRITSQDAVRGWMDSKPHREALLDPKYESTGFGIAGYKVVQHLCDES